MKILLTGANGYIGMRLLPFLLEQGHELVCCVRDRSRLEIPEAARGKLEIFEVDFLKEIELAQAPGHFDVAYYLIHSMSTTEGDFESLEERAAHNFVRFVNAVKAEQIVYLSGIANEEKLSKHLRSRYRVENILKKADSHYTILRAGIIVGSGSASFEIIRDLVEKLPLMIAPKWLKTRCQPIAIRNVLQYLHQVAGNKACYRQVFDIGGPDILTYRQMLLQFAEVRGLKRYILSVPVMTPRLSSYWLYFVTSTSYPLAVNLVNSMKVDVVVEKEGIRDIIPLALLSYRDAVRRAFDRIEQHMVISSWKDALSSSTNYKGLSQFVEVPRHGVFRDQRVVRIEGHPKVVIDNFFSIGGNQGWYYGATLWKLRGLLDKLAGGVGLRRGRTHEHNLYTGDALDFWRVLLADREEGRLLLYAEMKLPGEAWLEWKLVEKEGSPYLRQTATFRPNGLLGRLYWYAVLPFHFFIFEGMARRIVKRNQSA